MWGCRLFWLRDFHDVLLQLVYRELIKVYIFANLSSLNHFNLAGKVIRRQTETPYQKAIYY